jgi:hypothetical protein
MMVRAFRPDFNFKNKIELMAVERPFGDARLLQSAIRMANSLNSATVEPTANLCSPHLVVCPIGLRIDTLRLKRAQHDLSSLELFTFSFAVWGCVVLLIRHKNKCLCFSAYRGYLLASFSFTLFRCLSEIRFFLCFTCKREPRHQSPMSVNPSDGLTVRNLYFKRECFASNKIFFHKTFLVSDVKPQQIKSVIMRLIEQKRKAIKIKSIFGFKHEDESIRAESVFLQVFFCTKVKCTRCLVAAKHELLVE